ncbi:MAG: class I adenylate-forming enzyme family protein [Myxococcota bacterium]|nr:class I adenylate-forming enzyme family protein [Myxococcota bacterium]
MPPTHDEVVAGLTGPGGPFEIVQETMQGRPVRVFKNRERSLREKVANVAGRGDADFLVQGERRISYGDFGRLVWGASAALRDQHGLRRGDRLAILSYNCPDWIIALFGASSVGAIGVGMNGWWVTEEIEYGLNDSGSRFLVVDERLYPRVEPLLGQLETLEKVFYIGAHPPEGTIPVGELLVPSDEIPDDPIEEDDPFVLLYTSGTTGRPKGCITTHRGTIAQVAGIFFANVLGMAMGGANPLADAQQSGRQPAGLLASPLFHVGGLHSNLCTAMTAGYKLVFIEGKFTPEQAMQLIEREKITIWGAIPTMLHRVVHHPDVGRYDLSTLRAISFGGAPTAPETIEKAREVLPIEPSFTNAYGLTETHGVATMNGGKDLLGKMTSIGRPLPFLDMKIIDEEGKELPEGQLGELLVYGPTITPGYWKQPEASAEAVREGWLHTGDLGYRDAEGFYFVVDRAKDMILRGGENVYCTEIENCLADHPDIDEAAVVGVPDPEFGERVKAIVKRAPGAAIDAAGIQAQVGAHLASYKVPEFVEFTEDPLPRNPAGKILKNVLRGEGAVPFDTESLD